MGKKRKSKVKNNNYIGTSKVPEARKPLPPDFKIANTSAGTDIKNSLSVSASLVDKRVETNAQPAAIVVVAKDAVKIQEPKPVLPEHPAQPPKKQEIEPVKQPEPKPEPEPTVVEVTEPEPIKLEPVNIPSRKTIPIPKKPSVQQRPKQIIDRREVISYSRNLVNPGDVVLTAGVFPNESNIEKTDYLIHKENRPALVLWCDNFVMTLVPLSTSPGTVGSVTGHRRVSIPATPDILATNCMAVSYLDFAQIKTANVSSCKQVVSTLSQHAVDMIICEYFRMIYIDRQQKCDYIPILDTIPNDIIAKYVGTMPPEVKIGGEGFVAEEKYNELESMYKVEHGFHVSLDRKVKELIAEVDKKNSEIDSLKNKSTEDLKKVINTLKLELSAKDDSIKKLTSEKKGVEQAYSDLHTKYQAENQNNLKVLDSYKKNITEKDESINKLVKQVRDYKTRKQDFIDLTNENQELKVKLEAAEKEKENYLSQLKKFGEMISNLQTSSTASSSIKEKPARRRYTLADAKTAYNAWLTSSDIEDSKERKAIITKSIGVDIESHNKMFYQNITDRFIEILKANGIAISDNAFAV